MDPVDRWKARSDDLLSRYDITAKKDAPKCAYCGGEGIVPGPLMEVSNCPVCCPTTTAAGTNPT